MRNVDIILQNMMKSSVEVLRPTASVARHTKAVELGYQTISAAVLVKEAQKMDKVQKKNVILDMDTLVPDELKQPSSEKTKVTAAAKTLSRARIRKSTSK